jgi:hypothetical protein
MPWLLKGYRRLMPTLSNIIRSIELEQTMTKIKYNINTHRPPCRTDDKNKGYSKDSIWKCGKNVSFTCIDPSENKAVWILNPPSQKISNLYLNHLKEGPQK